MPKRARLLILLLVSLAVAAPAMASPSPDTVTVRATKKKHHIRRIPRGVGFLPGYRTPAQIERDRYRAWRRERRAYERSGAPPVTYYYWGYPRAQFYRGRWNGGSFGPCWTVTPIGYQWNCGR